MPRTGNKCKKPGIYQSDCCRREITLAKGKIFPPCPGCHKGINWTLVRATRPAKKSFWDNLLG